MSALLQGIAWGLGTARLRAAMGRALLRVALVLTAMILVLLAVGYLLDAASGALAATRSLAEEHVQRALAVLEELPAGAAREALVTVALASLERMS